MDERDYLRLLPLRHRLEIEFLAELLCLHDCLWPVSKTDCCSVHDASCLEMMFLIVDFGDDQQNCSDKLRVGDTEVDRLVDKAVSLHKVGELLEAHSKGLALGLESCFACTERAVHRLVED